MSAALAVAGALLVAAWGLRPSGDRVPTGEVAPRGARPREVWQAVRHPIGRLGAGQRAARTRDAAVPELIDLFAIAASAGLPPASCLVHVAPRAPDPLAHPMADAAGALVAGTPFREVLDALGESLGPRGRPLVGVLADAASRGTPLAPALDAVAREARDVQRRVAQERARRLPVVLLFPLVLCTLPAAVLVTVVPVVVVAVRSLAV